MHLSSENLGLTTLNYSAAEFTPRQYKLHEFDEQYPALSALYFDISNTDEVPQAMCAMTQCRNFAPLLGEIDSAAPVLVLFLPQSFERLLPQLAASQLRVHNWQAMDLSENITYCRWSIEDAAADAKDTDSLGVWLPEYLLEVLERDAGKKTSSLNVALEERVEFHPVIWVAGDTVVVSRLCIDNLLRIQINVCVLNARSHDPKALSTPEEVFDAQQQHAANPTPWRDRLYTLESNGFWPRQHVVEPAAYDCRAWQM